MSTVGQVVEIFAATIKPGRGASAEFWFQFHGHLGAVKAAIGAEHQVPASNAFQLPKDVALGQAAELRFSEFKTWLAATKPQIVATG